MSFRYSIPLLASLLLSSCSPESPRTSDGSSSAAAHAKASVNVMTCTLNGVPWQADQTSEEGSNKFTLQLSGHHKASQNKIVIFFNRAKAVAGTVIPIKFKMGEVAEAGVTLAAVDAEGMPTGESKSASTATITISEVSDTRITGTFEGTNTGLTITDGKFDMDFTRIW
jgi:hypothetical protein